MDAIVPVEAVEKIHLIFKTHLDLGFTDMANAVFRHYMTDFIPAALRLARALREQEAGERFVWTTGSWLIYHYLEQAAAAERRLMEDAIAAGDIAWHALPFTMHCEMLDADLFRFGLSLSQRLDARFGQQTTAAKMTDVPGHTRAIVPLLAEAGIKLLHIGVNEASTMPDVPPVFVWRDAASQSDMLVIYEHHYGGLVQVNGLREALAVQMTGDNIGPPGLDTVHRVYSELRRRFPQAQIVPTTLATFAAALETVRAALPVITDEIGDTWIHGIGTDPEKVRAWRELVRLRRDLLAHGGSRPGEAALFAFQDALLCVAEHTWGMDVKLHTADFHSYSAGEFAAARAGAAFHKLEVSWAEQRGYLDQAVAALAGTAWHARAAAALEPHKALLPSGAIRADRLQFSTARFEIGFDAQSGAINHLRSQDNGQVWAAPEHPLALFRYETFDQADYDRFWAEYIQGKDRESIVAWAQYDYCKPGIRDTAVRHLPTPAALDSLYVNRHEGRLSFTAVLALPAGWASAYGAPPVLYLNYEVFEALPQIDIRLSWQNKPASRLPEALWLSFVPFAADGRWRFEKLNQWIDPTQVISGGNRGLHAVFDRVVCANDRQRLTLVTRGAPLVAAGKPSLLRFSNTVPDLSGGVHVNLFNNVWGTNFPQWHEGDASFTFQLLWEQGG